MKGTFSRAYGSPMRYIQGPGEIRNLALHAAQYGSFAYILIDGFIFEGIKARLDGIFAGSDVRFHAARFGGESSQEEVDKAVAEIAALGADLIIGLGGGKTIDTTKLIADHCGIPRIIMPSSASTDAPTAGLAGLYRPDGVQIRAIKTRRNSELVLLDTEIIVNAPARLFSAGMGDALATWFEARANWASLTPNYIGSGYRPTRAAMAIARECSEILFEDGRGALAAVKQHLITEEVENVIEANTLLSGLGFENTGCAAAHGIHAGLSEMDADHRDHGFHGEKVAFSILAMMVIENTPHEEMDRTIRFLMDIDLPVTLEQLNIEPTDENLDKIVDHTVNHNNLIHHEPHIISEKLVKHAILAANAIGHRYLDGCV